LMQLGLYKTSLCQLGLRRIHRLPVKSFKN
jgi:hypothetical protein